MFKPQKIIRKVLSSNTVLPNNEDDKPVKILKVYTQ